MVIQGEEVVKAILFLASVVLGIYVLIYLLKRGFSFTGILFRKLIKIIHPITYPFYGKLSILSALIGMLFLADLIDGKNYMAGVMCILLSPVIFFAGKLFSDLFFKAFNISSSKSLYSILEPEFEFNVIEFSISKSITL